MKEFAGTKEQQKARYWHILNLPLCIHYAGDGVPQDKAHTLMQSLLRVLNDFAHKFGALPGAGKTLEPLWTDAAWNIDPPELWSILATAFLALSYAANGETVQGFGVKIGNGDRDSDIQFRQGDGTLVHVDVEAWHAVKFADLDPAKARIELRRRVEEKCGRKLRDLPTGEIGVAAIVCMAAGLKFELMVKHAELAGLVLLDERYLGHQFGYVYWVGGLGDGDSLWVAMLDEKSLRKYMADNAEKASGDQKPA